MSAKGKRTPGSCSQETGGGRLRDRGYRNIHRGLPLRAPPFIRTSCIGRRWSGGGIAVPGRVVRRRGLGCVRRPTPSYMRSATGSLEVARTRKHPDIPIRLEVREYVVVDCHIGPRRSVERMGRRRESRAAIERFGPRHLVAFEDAKRRTCQRGIFEVIGGRLPPAKRNRKPRHVGYRTTRLLLGFEFAMTSQTNWVARATQNGCL